MILISLMCPHEERSPAVFVNDACYGKFDGESDEYSAADECLNALVMVPCLRKVRSRAKLSVNIRENGY